MGFQHGAKATWANMESYLKRRIKIHEGHWLWTKRHNHKGYGYLDLDGVATAAHRVSYIVFVGPILEDKPFVLHKRGICHIRKCINPEHLYVGTAAENTADMMADGRHVRAMLRIPDETVRLIRLRCLSGESQADVAVSLNLSQQHVSDLVNFKCRKDVT